MKRGMYYFTLVCVMLLVGAAIVDATVITSLPYDITARGYYKINTNLTSTGTGITVKANNVTIDLNGYTIAGNKTNTSRGIYMNGRSNIEIRNGTIRDFGSHGIFEESLSGHSHRVINVRVMNNKGIGIILLGSNHMVKDCTASNNVSYGIYTKSGSTVSGNTAYGNGDSGIATGAGSTVSGNTAYNNVNYGIDAASGCTVTGNTAYANGNDGIYAASGCTVKNNTSYYNEEYGIYLTGYDLVDGNTAYQNNQAGVYANMSTCPTCVFGVNIQ